MPLQDSFVIWNDKGGVGKTTLTFHMSTEYAARHPDQKILVIDLCRHANVSMALLALPSFDTEKLKKMKIPEKKSISSYLHDVTNLKPLSVVDPEDFLIKVSDFNTKIPANVFLLRGDDVDLELMAPSLEQKRLKEISKDSIVSYKPWKYITSCVRYFIEGYGNMRGVATDANDWVVFIDTSTSFSIYTQMAIVAAKRLIIPTNADDFSREALKSTLSLVYGVPIGERSRESVDKTGTFSFKVKTFKISLPEIGLVIHNRQTLYKKQPIQAHSLIARSISDVVSSAYESHRKELFEQNQNEGSPLSRDAVEKKYYVGVQDFHTVGLGALHMGKPLRAINSSTIKILGETVKLNRDQLDDCKNSLKDLVDMVEKLCSHSSADS